MVDNKALVPYSVDTIQVLTSTQIADAHNISNDLVRKQYNNNKGRFIEGLDVFSETKGLQLRAFGEPTTAKAQFNTNRMPLLFSESGYLKLCKILNTNEAWDTYNHIADVYFRVKKAKQRWDDWKRGLSEDQIELSTQSEKMFSKTVSRNRLDFAEARITVYEHGLGDANIRKPLLNSDQIFTLTTIQGNVITTLKATEPVTSKREYKTVSQRIVELEAAKVRALNRKDFNAANRMMMEISQLYQYVESQMTEKDRPDYDQDPNDIYGC